MKKVSENCRKKALIWIDMNRELLQQVDAIQSLATHDIDEGYVNMILTYDQSSEAIEKMEDDLGFEDISLADLDSTTVK